MSDQKPSGISCPYAQGIAKSGQKRPAEQATSQIYNPETGQMEEVSCPVSGIARYAIPGTYNPVRGIYEMMRLRRGVIESLEEGRRKYGRFAYNKAGPFDIYQISHPDLIREIFVKKHTIFKRPERWKNAVTVFDQGGILSVEDEEWKRQRQGNKHHFSSVKINAKFDIIARLAHDHVKRWQKQGGEIDVRQETGHYAFDVLHQVLLGGHFPEGSDKLRAAMEDMQGNMLGDILSIMPLPARISTFLNPRWRKAQQYFEQLIDEKITAYRENPPKEPDLLAGLIANIEHYQGSETEKHERLGDELFQILFAGHETFANGSAWAIHTLARRPEIAEAIAAEVQHVCGDKPLTFEDLPQLDYTSRVFSEAIRLYPPIYGNVRQANAETTLGGHTIPKGAYIGVPVVILHRDPEYYPDPLHFDPDRFLPGNFAKIPRDAYIPWGAGAHRCMGQNMATLEGLSILAECARQLVLKPVPGQETMPKERGLVTLSPEPDSRISLAPRQTVDMSFLPPRPSTEETSVCPYHRG